VAAITASSNLKLYQNLVNIASARLVSQLHSGEENNGQVCDPAPQAGAAEQELPPQAHGL
jgi:hypothetical protein